MKILKKLIYIPLILIAILLLYLLISYIFFLFPHKAEISNSNLNRNEEIYLLYDSFHTDIVIDIERSEYDWKRFFPELLKRNKGYLGFGWGDKETYLTTPTWDKLKFSTAIKALFISTPSLLHVSRYGRVDRFLSIKTIKVSYSQKRLIEKKILESFGKKVIFERKGYRYNDAFYYSPYKYNLINTCNTWSGRILRESNITMGYWTPLSFSVVNSLKD